MIEIKKSKGYTLAEVLITFAVVGVLAVVLLVAVNRSHQDKDKTLYLKTSTRLTNIVDTLLNDEIAYPNKDKEGDGNGEEPKYIYTDSLFYNTFIYYKLKQEYSDLSIGSHNSKLCRLIAEKGYRVDGSACDDNNKDLPEYSAALTPSFSTHDGIDFYVYTQTKEIVETDFVEAQNDKGKSVPFGKYVVPYKTIVYIDTNGKDKGNNCMFNKQSCINPDVFEFMIQADGQILPMDSMGLYYAQNSRDMKKKVFNAKNSKDAEILERIAALLPDEVKQDKLDNAVAYIRPIVNKDSDPKEEIGNATTIEYNDTGDVTFKRNGGGGPGGVQNSEPVAECTSIACKYDCTKAPLDPGYGSYTEGGGCADGTATMYNENREGTYEEAKNYCASIGARLPTTFELSAASNYVSQMGFSVGNYWAEQNWSEDLRSGTQGYVRNCYMPDGNCGVHNPNDKQYYRCVKK